MAKQVTGNEAQFNEKVTFLKNIDVNQNVVVGSAVTINASTGEISANEISANEISANSFVGSGVTINSSGINVSGAVTATSFVGDGTGITGVIAVNNGVYVSKNNVLVGTPGIGVTIGLGTGLNGEQPTAGIVTIFLDAAINDLTNVNASPNTSDVLQWNGSNWVSANPTSIGSTIWKTVPTGAGTTQVWYNEGPVAIGTDTVYSSGGLYVRNGLGVDSIGFCCNGRLLSTTRSFSLGASVSATSSTPDNLMFGFRTGLSNTTGSCNIFLGYFAAGGSSTGCHNNFIGAYSGGGNGCYNNAIGYRSGYNLYTGSDNNYIGVEAGCGIIVNSTGFRNNFIGYHAGRLIASGSDNVSIGSSSGYSNTSGSNNVFVGTLAGYANTTGNYNTIIGYAAGIFNTTGCENVFIGRNAGLNNTTGTNNVYIGRGAGQSNTSSSSNIAIGELSLCQNTKFSNIAIGSGAGCNLTGGLNACGTYNILIGTSSGDTLTTGYNNIIIGDRGIDGLGISQSASLKGFTTESQRISIGNVCTTNFYTKMAAKSHAATTVKWCSTTYELAADTSSCRFKTNIEPFLSGVAEILKLNSVQYNPIENPDGPKEIGLIAEEVADSGLTQIISFDEEDKPLSVSYDRMAALFINAIKELHQENQTLKQEIAEIKKHLDL